MNVYEMLVHEYNRLVRLYYISNFLTKESDIKKVLSTLRDDELYIERIDYIVAKGHLYLRKVPKKYLDKITHREFRPLGVVISEGIDVDMFLGILVQIANLIRKLLLKKLSKITKWVKVIYIIAISSRSTSGKLRHVEAHMICTVPNGMEGQLSEKAFDLLERFIKDAGYQFMIGEIITKEGKRKHTEIGYERGYDVKGPSNMMRSVIFKLYDFNYPARRNEQPLTQYYTTKFDIPIPGLKASAVIPTSGKWWIDVTESSVYANVYY